MAQSNPMERASLMLMSIARASALCLVITAFTSVPSDARTIYDGRWGLTFVTQRGGCDASYHFSVNIINGVVSHPNLVKFTGRVTARGKVRASVSVPGKFASGSGRLSRTDGRGRWSGYADKERCSGYWTAQRS